MVIGGPQCRCFASGFEPAWNGPVRGRWCKACPDEVARSTRVADVRTSALRGYAGDPERLASPSRLSEHLGGRGARPGVIMNHVHDVRKDIMAPNSSELRIQRLLIRKWLHVVFSVTQSGGDRTLSTFRLAHVFAFKDSRCPLRVLAHMLALSLPPG